MGEVQPSAVCGLTTGRPVCVKASGRANGCSEILAWIHNSACTLPVRRDSSFPANNSSDAQIVCNLKIQNEAWKLTTCEVLFIRYIPISSLRLGYIEWRKSQHGTSLIHTLPLCVNWYRYRTGYTCQFQKLITNHANSILRVYTSTDVRWPDGFPSPGHTYRRETRRSDMLQPSWQN
jgi:hypothetical protein